MKRSLDHQSIRGKLTRIILISCGIAVVSACVIFAAYDIRVTRQSRLRTVATLAEITGTNSIAALSFRDEQSGREILRSLRADKQLTHAALYTPEGKVLAVYSRDPQATVFAPPSTETDGADFVAGKIVAFHNIELNGKPAGTIYLESDLSMIVMREEGLAAMIGFGLFVSLLLAALVGSRMQSSISEPILELARTAFAIAVDKNYSVRMVSKSEDEIGFLYEQFNSMLARIQDRDRELEQGRTELEQRVAERTAYLKALVETSPMGIVTTDPQGRVQVCNTAFEHLFQYVRDEIAGTDLDSLIAPPELSEEAADFTRRSDAGESIQKVTKRRRKDGSMVDVELYGTPMHVGNEHAGGLIIYHDISERKQTEEALLSAKETAEEANRAKSEFLANMSHEIRTPMNGILGMTQLTLETPLTGEQREYLGMVKSSADSLLTLLNDILDFSKIEAGKFDLDLSPFALRETMGEALKALGHLAHRKGLELAWQVDTAVPEWLVGDSGRLRQILVNLVMNAIKFTEHGEVVVSVNAESRTSDNVELHFSVRDTGIGILPEKQRLIFAAFTQADNSTTRKYGGTGLGLSISQALVKMMDGGISVESEPRKGSIFHFTARLSIPESSFIPPPAIEPDALRGLPALVVDDNQTNRLILTQLLSQWGLVPEQAASGSEALELLANTRRSSAPFRLALIDADMPEMDGFALAERIKKTAEASAPSMFMLSSTMQSGDITRSREAGLAGFLTKPVQPSELLDAILGAMSKTGRIPSVAEDVQSPRQVSSTGGGMRILLAEDNLVNRQLATRLLEKRGYTVLIAKNGVEAVAAVEHEEIDLVLMDVQMPEMDGLEAIRSIRATEKVSGRHLPIVSLTAHVMKGDREKCIEAGADDYIPKPIQAPSLFAAIERMSIPKCDDEPSMSTDIPSDSLNTAELLEQVQGDRELLAEIVQLFESGLPAILQGLRESIARGDAPEIARIAHTLRGSVGNFGRRGAYRAVEQMEKLAKEGDIAETAKALVAVESELESLLAALESFRTPAAEAVVAEKTAIQ
ncbi:MAG TPA: response regulator [Candidatus Acidoferrales bacterium]|nr:response regulator [Candidatus Acidoferrales bacterium]